MCVQHHRGYTDSGMRDALARRFGGGGCQTGDGTLVTPDTVTAALRGNSHEAHSLAWRTWSECDLTAG